MVVSVAGFRCITPIFLVQVTRVMNTSNITRIFYLIFCCTLGYIRAFQGAGRKAIWQQVRWSAKGKYVPDPDQIRSEALHGETF